MKIEWKTFSTVSLGLLLALNLLSRPAATQAQPTQGTGGNGVALAPSTTADGQPACWIAVGTKLYYVEKDESTVLKVRASGNMGN